MKSVLIIEDDPLMMRMYQRVFKFSGINAEAASDGKEGLEKAKRRKPALILLDVMMPQMNGLEVLGELKNNSDTKDIPVIMLTNISGSKDSKKALAMGAVEYIVKSDYNPEEVADKAKKYLKENDKKE